MSVKIATTSGNSISIESQDRDATRKLTYNKNEIEIHSEVTRATGEKVVSLLHNGIALISVSSDSGSPFAGNSIFGETDPDDIETIATQTIGLSASGGSGGGISQAQVQAAIQSATNIDGIENLLGTQDTKLSQLITLLQGDRAISSWLFTDSTNTTYLRVLAYNQQLNSFESVTLTLAGAPYTPVLPEQSILQTDFDTVETTWKIITAGIGYSVDDIVSQFQLITQGPPVAVVDTLWFNQATQLPITAPPVGHRRREGAALATEASLSALVSLITNQNALIGAINESAPSSDTDNSGLNGRLQRIAQRLTTLINRFLSGGQQLVNSIAVALPRKETITGVLSTAATNLNLLDSTGSGAPTDVRDFNSGELTIVSTATTGSYSVQGSTDAGFTNPTILQLFEVTVQNANPINAAITPTNSTRKFLVNLQGVNFFRVNLTTATANIRPILVLGQLPHVPNQVNVQQAVAANLLATASLATGQTLATVTTVGTVNSSRTALPTLITDVASSAITANNTTAAITPASGNCCNVLVLVTAVAGTNPSLVVRVQESPDTGTTWMTIGQITITAAGAYHLGSFKLLGNRVRYEQVVSGVGASFTRSIIRAESNNLPAIGTCPVFTGGSTVTGGTAQFVPLALRNRQYLAIQNLSSNVLRIRGDGLAASAGNGSWRLGAGETIEFPGSGAGMHSLSIFSATSGDEFTIIEA